MSEYEQLQKKPSKDFKRLISVNEETFETMIEVFKACEIDRKKSWDRRQKKFNSRK